MKRLVSVLLAAVMVMTMSGSVFAAGLTGRNAQDIALKNANLKKSRVKFLKTKYDREDGRYEVDFKRKKNGAKYSYEIGAVNGQIYELSIEYKTKRNRSRKKIGLDKALMAASTVSGVSLEVVQNGKCKYEYDDGMGIYEIEFINGLYEYDIEILAPTGKVREFRWEYKGI